VRGTARDIVMHERLEHGVLDFFLEEGEEMDHTSVGGQRPVMIPESIQPAEELVQLLQQAEVKYAFGRRRYGFDNSFCLFTFGDCKVSVDRHCDCDKVGIVYVYIWYQTGQKTLPVELASIGFGELTYGDTTEADEGFLRSSRRR
jgi:hypothetical protein